jgi:hypothetical protein
MGRASVLETRRGRLPEGSVAAEDAKDQGIQPPRDLAGDAAELDLEFEGLFLAGGSSSALGLWRDRGEHSRIATIRPASA